jgi:hypothetical protein
MANWPKSATLIGIQPKLVRWGRQKDNRGVLRILVPPEWAASRDKSTDMPAIQAAITSLQAAFDAALSAALSAKDGEIATLRETLSAERGRADRAVAAMAGLNEHLADLRAKLADAQAELVGAQIAPGRGGGRRGRAEPGRSRAAGEGPLARLRAAWRGSKGSFDGRAACGP